MNQGIQLTLNVGVQAAIVLSVTYLAAQVMWSLRGAGRAREKFASSAESYVSAVERDAQPVSGGGDSPQTAG